MKAIWTGFTFGLELILILAGCQEGAIRDCLPADDQLDGELRPDLLGGVVVVKAKALREAVEHDLVAIPYYSWAHRGRGGMIVWLKSQ